MGFITRHSKRPWSAAQRHASRARTLKLLCERKLTDRKWRSISVDELRRKFGCGRRQAYRHRRAVLEYRRAAEVGRAKASAMPKLFGLGRHRKFATEWQITLKDIHSQLRRVMSEQLKADRGWAEGSHLKGRARQPSAKAVSLAALALGITVSRSTMQREKRRLGLRTSRVDHADLGHVKQVVEFVKSLRPARGSSAQ